MVTVLMLLCLFFDYFKPNSVADAYFYAGDLMWCRFCCLILEKFRFK